MNITLLNTQALTILLPIASLFVGCDRAAETPPKVWQPEPVVIIDGVGELWPLNARRTHFVIPVGAPLTIRLGEHSLETQPSKGQWREWGIAYEIVDGLSSTMTTTPLGDGSFSLRMPDSRLDLLEFSGSHGSFGTVSSPRVWADFVPVAFTPSTHFSRWEIMLDRRTPETTLITFKGDLGPAASIDLSSMSLSMNFLDTGNQDSDDPHEYSYAPAYLPDDRHTQEFGLARIDVDDYDIPEKDGDRVVSYTVKISGKEFGPLSIMELSNDSLVVPVTDFVSPVLLFTNARPKGAQITSEEFEKREGMVGF